MILQDLAKHPSPMVRHWAFTGIGRLGAHCTFEREVIEMLLASEIGDDPRLAEEMCGAVDYKGIHKEHLSGEQVRVMLDKLVATKEIDGHHIERFLAWVSEHFPSALFEFTLPRLDRDAEIEKANEQGDEKITDYSPIPRAHSATPFVSCRMDPVRALP